MSAAGFPATSDLRLVCPATLDRPKAMRHALESFMDALNVAKERRDDILTAVGEALANAVEHAHAPGVTGVVSLVATLVGPARMVIEISDDGQFVQKDEPTPFRGFGLRIMGAIAQDLCVEIERGTLVRMSFALD